MLENVSIAAPYTPTMLLVGNVSIRYNVAATLTRLRMINCLELSQCQCRTIGDGRSSTLTCLRMKNRLVVPMPTVEREYKDVGKCQHSCALYTHNVVGWECMYTLKRSCDTSCLRLDKRSSTQASTHEKSSCGSNVNCRKRVLGYWKMSAKLRPIHPQCCWLVMYVYAITQLRHFVSSPGKSSGALTMSMSKQ